MTASADPALSARITAVHALPGVRAGSALLRVGDRLVAVQDDAWSMIWIQLPDLTVHPQILQGDGAALPKKHKPDFEAALRATDGSIHLFGSGSAANRCTVARILTISATQTRVKLHPLPALYDAVRQALALDGPPNIEAALHLGHRLRLFHRGAASTASGYVDLPLSALQGEPCNVLTARQLHFGQLDGVPLHITDAALRADGTTIFLAAAEQTDNAIADGPVAGSVIGLLPEEAHATPRWTRLIDPDGYPSRRKTEGLALDADGRAAWLLTDPDSTTLPAELCRVILDGFI